MAPLTWQNGKATNTFKLLRKFHWPSKVDWSDKEKLIVKAELVPLEKHYNASRYKFSLKDASSEIRNGIFILEDESGFCVGADIKDVLNVLTNQSYSDNPLRLSGKFMFQTNDGYYVHEGIYRVFDRGIVGIFLKQDASIEIQLARPWDSSLVIYNAVFPQEKTGNGIANDLQVAAFTPTTAMLVSAKNGPIVHSFGSALVRPEIKREPGTESNFLVIDKAIGNSTGETPGSGMTGVDFEGIALFTKRGGE